MSSKSVRAVRIVALCLIINVPVAFVVQAWLSSEGSGPETAPGFVPAYVLGLFITPLIIAIPYRLRLERSNNSRARKVFGMSPEGPRQLSRVDVKDFLKAAAPGALMIAVGATLHASDATQLFGKIVGTLGLVALVRVVRAFK